MSFIHFFFVIYFPLSFETANILTTQIFNYSNILTRLCQSGLLPFTTILTVRRLQPVQFAAASFVLGHYVKNLRDVVSKIGWLPINERRDLNLLKSCFKALHNDETWPDYLKIIKQECPKELRSSNSIRLVVPTENGTFQDNASKLFNNLPETIKKWKDYAEPFQDSQRFF